VAASRGLVASQPGQKKSGRRPKGDARFAATCRDGSSSVRE
jgi:hypothetical protein